MQSLTSRISLLGMIMLTGMLSACTGCSEKRKSPAAQPGNSAAGLPGMRLQRVFSTIEIDTPILMLQSPNDNQHWYVVEKAGRILQLSGSNAIAHSSVFVDISDRVDSSPNEAGLLGMAFHPQYESNGLVYLSYTTSDPDLTSVISRFKTSNDGNTLLADSEQVLLRVSQPYSNHNGGHIAFGSDGYLYIGLGDGGSGGDPREHGQNTRTLLGSMLRIDVNQGSPYSIPAGNPFASGKGGRPEIYAWGLRNPWRWSFDRETGDLWVADVGQNAWEEINLIRGPGNFGWNGKEGTHCYESSNCNNPEFIDPVLEYGHDLGCSVTGGYVYRGNAIPALQGSYLFSDFCSGTLWVASKNAQDQYTMTELLSTGLNVASFAQSNEGEIFVIGLEGELHQLLPM